MKKPRPDAKLMTLPDALQEELYQLLRRTTLEKVKEWLLANHDVATSTGSLSKFFSWYPQSAWLKHSADFADQMKACAAKFPALAGKADEISAIAQAAFELQAAQDRDSGLHLALAKARLKTDELRIKQENLKLSERKVKLLEAAAALVDQAKAIGEDKDLTAEEQLTRYRQIFGG
jgi:hypothetical protein